MLFNFKRCSQKFMLYEVMHIYSRIIIEIDGRLNIVWHTKGCFSIDVENDNHKWLVS